MNKMALGHQAGEAAQLLRAMANERRLIILCELGRAERTVGELAGLLGIAQSALSQHLARLRAQGLVRTRRRSQTISYALASPEAERLIAVLSDLYCGAQPEEPTT